MSMTRSYLLDHRDPERVEARRQEIKTKIAQRQSKQFRVDSLVELLQDVQADLQQAQADHDAAIEPLQRELAELDEARVSAILVGKTPKDDTSRRRELNRAVYDAGRELEIAKHANHESQRKLNREIEGLRVEIGRDAALESQLERLAPLGLQAQSQGVGELRTTMLRHLESLASAQRATEDQLNDDTARYAPHGRTVLTMKVDKLRTQTAALSAFIDSLRARGEDLRSQLLEA